MKLDQSIYNLLHWDEKNVQEQIINGMADSKQPTCQLTSSPRLDKDNLSKIRSRSVSLKRLIKNKNKYKKYSKIHLKILNL